MLFSLYTMYMWNTSFVTLKGSAAFKKDQCRLSQKERRALVVLGLLTTWKKKRKKKKRKREWSQSSGQNAPCCVSPMQSQELARLWTGGWRPTLLLPFLLTQELKHGGEIFTSITACTHHAVNLMGQRTERDRSLCVGGCVLSESEILEGKIIR